MEEARDIKRFQDKVSGIVLAILATVVLMFSSLVTWVYISDRSEYRDFMKDQRQKNQEIERAMERMNERMDVGKEKFQEKDKQIQMLWEKYSELRDGKKH